jgi:hypothetical protein
MVRPPKSAQGIKAIPSEYVCLKKIVTPSDHNLKIAAISFNQHLHDSDARWVFHVRTSYAVDAIAFNFFCHNAHRSISSTILGPDLLLIKAG